MTMGLRQLSDQQTEQQMLLVLHKCKQNPDPMNTVYPALESQKPALHEAAHWETCVREITFGLTTKPLNEHPPMLTEVFSGRQAYEFSLEVICGLRSPLLGETEVFGQFKELFDRHWKASPQSQLSRIFFELNRDAKEIRRIALQNLGHQSYPGLLRKKLKSVSSVHVIGAGHLSSEIVQWLRKTGKDIEVFARNPSRANEFQKRFPTVKINELNLLTNNSSGALVVAAPIAADDLQNWLRGKIYAAIYDLRGESKEDQLKHPSLVASLHELFAEIEEGKETILTKVNEAKNLIAIKSQEALKTFNWSH